MASLGEANIGGRMVPAWLLNLTAEELDSLKSRWYSNPNLLDNWYFVNPVNQRGKTSYSVNGCTIDRWYTSHSISFGTLIVDQTAGCVTISHDDDGGIMDFYQTLENPATEIVTLSVLMLNGNLYSATGTLGNISLCTDEMCILSSNPSTVALRCNTGKTISMIAAKLELGSQQTLAHQENGVWHLNEIPNYGEQLRRCQGVLLPVEAWKCYSGRIDNEGTAYIEIPTPVSMRSGDGVPVIIGEKKGFVYHASGLKEVTYVVASFGANSVTISASGLGITNQVCSGCFSNKVFLSKEL